MNKRFSDRPSMTGRPAPRRQRCLAMSLTAVLVLGGCSNDVVPLGASLTLSPETHSTVITEWQDSEGHCLFNSEHHVDIPLIMQLATADGSPIGEALLSVYVDFAANTYTGLPVLALYDDLNGNGVVDAESELISGPDDDIAQVETDRWTGSRMLLLRINLSCSFKGEVVAFTGGSSARASIDVLANDINPLEDTEVEEKQ